MALTARHAAREKRGLTQQYSLMRLPSKMRADIFKVAPGVETYQFLGLNHHCRPGCCDRFPACRKQPVTKFRPASKRPPLNPSKLAAVVLKEWPLRSRKNCIAAVEIQRQSSVCAVAGLGHAVAVACFAWLFCGHNGEGCGQELQT